MTTAPKGNRGPSAGPENRRALIAAAREVFAQDGLRAPLSAIARRAGVGQGSLYRHFPDRLALAVAVFDDNVSELERAMPHPDATLDDLLDRMIAQALTSTALIELIAAHQDDERTQRLGDRVRGLVARVVEREQTAGRIGGHIAVDDVLLAISMLAGELSRTLPDARAEVARRAWSLFYAAFAP
ncbi:TetR/AcrR family transcriptional regulator [Salinibacterium sp. SYSU T00001]|uniref:TetR/AcrR family transcriptional regulator n=1 Tax=Homoserinimonas sedimenticola TaxID=2986805 RepID=UPI0022357D9B|nr:TetR/AcrR family transcriptional regulator [Salinibacterium sedimenticola]MCW4385682.1 TetR/AcrR family transcriptional regulator [Salinibacterium sedimenticola]